MGSSPDTDIDPNYLSKFCITCCYSFRSVVITTYIHGYSSESVVLTMDS